MFFVRLEHSSRYVLPNVDSRNNHLQIYANLGEGERKYTRRKSLIDWMRRRDMKNPHFRSSVSTEFDECCRLFCFLNFNLVDLILDYE